MQVETAPGRSALLKRPLLLASPDNGRGFSWRFWIRFPAKNQGPEMDP